MSERRIVCAWVPVNGTRSFILRAAFTPSQLQDPKWVSQGISIDGRSHLVLYKPGRTDKNKLAVKLTGMMVYGPAIFVLLDRQSCPTDISISKLKKLTF